MRTILYATDYSDNSVAALKYAYALSLKLKKKLWVIHVFDNPEVRKTETDGNITDFELDALREHNANLESFCEKHLGKNLIKKNIEVDAIQDKSPINGIIAKSEKVQSILIAVGMTGASKLRRLIMGSTARNLIKKAPYPILTIPTDASYNEIKTLVYATDFQEEDLDAIKKLAEIAKPLKAKINIVHVAPAEAAVSEEMKTEIKKKIDKFVDYKNVDLDFLYSDDIFKELKIYFGKTNADIIAVLDRESKSFAADLFYTSLVKKMKSYGRIPLLSFNAINYGIFHL